MHSSAQLGAPYLLIATVVCFLESINHWHAILNHALANAGAVVALPIYVLADAGAVGAPCQPEKRKEPKLIQPAASRPGVLLATFVRRLLCSKKALLDALWICCKPFR